VRFFTNRIAEWGTLVKDVDLKGSANESTAPSLEMAGAENNTGGEDTQWAEIQIVPDKIEQGETGQQGETVIT
jgi:hypothetical protein